MPLWKKVDGGAWRKRLVFRKDKYAQHVVRDANGDIVYKNGEPTYMTVGSSLKNTGTMGSKPLFNKYHYVSGQWKPVYKYALVQTSPTQTAKNTYMVISDCLGNITTAGQADVFTSCSATCGDTGVKTRKFKCVRVESNRDSNGSYEYTDVTDDYCTKAGLSLNSLIKDGDGNIIYDTRTSIACNRTPCNLYFYGGVDDKMQVWAKSSPSAGWTPVKAYSGFGGSAKHNTCCIEKIGNPTPFSGSTAYVKIRFRDDAGGSTGSTALMLRICKNNPMIAYKNATTGVVPTCISCSNTVSDCTGWIVNSGYMRHYSSGHTTYLWFTVNMNSLTYTRDACSHASDNKYNKADYSSGGRDSACGNYRDYAQDSFGPHAVCSRMGWGYINCGLGEPY